MKQILLGCLVVSWLLLKVALYIDFFIVVVMMREVFNITTFKLPIT